MKSEEEVEELRNKLSDFVDENSKRGLRSRWSGMTYESGVEATLDWILGDIEEDPFYEE